MIKPSRNEKCFPSWESSQQPCWFACNRFHAVCLILSSTFEILSLNYCILINSLKSRYGNNSNTFSADSTRVSSLWCLEFTPLKKTSSFGGIDCVEAACDCIILSVFFENLFPPGLHLDLDVSRATVYKLKNFHTFQLRIFSQLFSAHTQVQYWVLLLRTSY